MAMSSDNNVTLHHDACVAVMDSIQRTIIDKGASRATRKAAFSALLVLIDAGLITVDASADEPARDKIGTTVPVGTRQRLMADAR